MRQVRPHLFVVILREMEKRENFFFFSVFSQRRKWGRKLVEPRIFLLGPPKCKLPKIGRKLERKCKGEKVLPFWTTLSPSATGFFFFWLCRFFRFCLLLELLLNSSHSFLFFYIFFHLFWFFFSSIFPPHLFCVIVLYNFL